MQKYGLKNKFQPNLGILINMLKTYRRVEEVRRRPGYPNYSRLDFSMSSTISSARRKSSSSTKTLTEPAPPGAAR